VSRAELFGVSRHEHKEALMRITLFALVAAAVMASSAQFLTIAWAGTPAVILAGLR
jgi:hypothetical protein